MNEGMGTQQQLIERTRAALAALLDMPSLLPEHGSMEETPRAPRHSRRSPGASTCGGPTATGASPTRRSPAADVPIHGEDTLEEVHTYQVARVLSHLAQRRKFDDPYWSGLLHRSVRAGQELMIPSLDEIARQARHLTTGAPRGSQLIEVLAGCTVRQPSSPRETLDLAMASWRLAGLDQAAMIAASECWRFEERDRADRLLDAVIASPRSSLHASYAWETRAALYLRSHGPAAAVEAFRIAASQDDARPGSIGELASRGEHPRASQSGVRGSSTARRYGECR